MRFSVRRADFFRGLIRHLMLGWLCAAFVEYLLITPRLRALDQLSGIAAMSLTRLVLITVLLASGLWAISLFFRIALLERFACAGFFAALSAISLRVNFSWPLLCFCLIVLSILTGYAILGHRQESHFEASAEKCSLIFPAITSVLTLTVFGAICAWTVCRVLTFSSPNYDFGIFSQMFYYMKQTGLPLTTLERSELLSHFAVHVSLIYYLMLPIYWLFPYPVTLQILQAAVITSAVIPMWLIGKQRGLSGLQRTLLCALLLLIPTTAGGAYYDLHENCFLLPLILWLLYAIDRKSLLLSGVFALLTLCVKEDAAVYVAVIALYWIVRTLVNPKSSRRELFTGIGLLVFSLGWFFAVTGYLATSGEGVMTNRYKNFDFDGSGSLIAVIKAVLLCPMKLLYECTKEPDRLIYIAQTLLPMLALPLLTRKFERYLLLIPYILVNLMPNWKYQYDVFFQYSFGSSALLLYLCAVNLADIRWKLPRVFSAACAVAVSCGFFFSLITPRITDTCNLYRDYSAYYQNVAEALETIPDDAIVTTHTFYAVPLSQRDIIYDLGYCSREQLFSSDYIVVKKTYKKEFQKLGVGDFEAMDSLLLENGYVQHLSQGSLIIYQKIS